MPTDPAGLAALVAELADATGNPLMAARARALSVLAGDGEGITGNVCPRCVDTTLRAKLGGVDYEAAYRAHEDGVERMSGFRHRLNDEGRANVRAIVDAALHADPSVPTRGGVKAEPVANTAQARSATPGQTGPGPSHGLTMPLSLTRCPGCGKALHDGDCKPPAVCGTCHGTREVYDMGKPSRCPACREQARRVDAAERDLLTHDGSGYPREQGTGDKPYSCCNDTQPHRHGFGAAIPTKPASRAEGEREALAAHNLVLRKRRHGAARKEVP